MVVITGQVPTAAIGSDAFQECDTTGITQSVTKHNFLVTEAADIPRTIREAFHIATTGRPGPVLVDIPKDIVDPQHPNSAMEWYWPDELDLPGYKPDHQGPPQDDPPGGRADQRRRTARSSTPAAASSRPGPPRPSKELAELCDIPVVTTLMARGAFPDSHPLCLGMPGMHGNYTAVTAMQKSDLLIALGSRFDDRVTGKLDGFAPDAKIIHVDIDPAELGKVRRPDVPIVGDCRLVIEELVEVLKGRGGLESQPDRSEWKSTLSGWQEKYPLTYQPAEEGEGLKPQYVLEELRDMTPDDTIVVSGVGQHQMWTSQYWKFDHPYTWVNSGGLGTMGFSVPAAIGAKVGRPDKMVWAVDGDGCFQMTAQELVTAAAERIPVKVAILNNAYLGMVRQWQEMFYDERYSEVYLSPDLPDYVKWAEAMGCVGLRAESPEEVGADHREGQQHRRPPGGHRLPDRRPREGVPDGRRRARRTTRSSSTRPRAKAATDARPDPHGRRPHPHALGPRREPGRRAHPHRRPVRPPGLQHLLAGRRPHRRRPLQPDHHRRRRRVEAARADHQAAPQADQRHQDQRARARRGRRAGADAGHAQGAGRRPGARSCELAELYDAESSTWA